VYERAAMEDAASTALILDRLDYLLDVADGPRKACVLLSEAVASSAVKDVDDARLWLRWAEISQQMADASDVVVGRCGAGALATPSPISILRRVLKRTPLHHRRAHTSISTELMRHLMSQEAPSPKIHDELEALFQKLISLSQGYECSISYVKKMKRDDSADDVDGRGDWGRDHGECGLDDSCLHELHHGHQLRGMHCGRLQCRPIDLHLCALPLQLWQVVRWQDL